MKKVFKDSSIEGVLKLVTEGSAQNATPSRLESDFIKIVRHSNPPKDEKNLLDLDDLDDADEFVLEMDDNRVTIPAPKPDRDDNRVTIPAPKSEKKDEEWLSQAMVKYLSEYRDKFKGLCSERVNGMFWMQQKRLPMKAYEFDDAVFRLYGQQQKRSAGEEPKYFDVLERVRSLLGSEFVEEVRRCHDESEKDFAQSIGNRLMRDGMDYLTQYGRYNPEFAQDTQDVLERRQARYTELNKKLQGLSPEYALMDIKQIIENSNTPGSRDKEMDDFYFGTRLMEKIDKMFEGGASPEELKRQILMLIKQSVHHEITTLCRDNNDERVKMKPSIYGKKWHRGIDDGLESYPTVSIDALLSITVRIARKTLNNTIHRDDYLLGDEAIQRKRGGTKDKSETDFADII